MKRKILTIICLFAVFTNLFFNQNMSAKAANKIIINEITITSEINNGMSPGPIECSVDATGNNLEYAWGIKLDKNRNWGMISDWSKNPNLSQIYSGSYFESIISCMVREKNNPDTMVYKNFRFSYHPYLKGKCQMPYDGGGYLIGCEVYNNDCTVEMLILDCTLLAEGKDAWVYTTGQCKVENNCMWTVWQPLYGYYWTLFRVYDKQGRLMDEYCYGFQNVDDGHKVPEREEDIQSISPKELNKMYDRIEVDGVEFDMSEFPESKVVYDNMEGVWPVPLEDIDFDDMKYVISGCEAEFLSSMKTDNLCNTEDYVIEENYYAGGWKNMIAYVHPRLWVNDNRYICEIYDGAVTGNFDISVYYKNQLLRTCNVKVETVDERLKKWRNWVDTIEVEAWTDDMDEREKLSAVRDYIGNNYLYSDGYRCNEGAAALYFAAKDLGLKARYRFVGPDYDYERGYGDEYYWGGMAFCGGHVCTVVTINGEDTIWNAQGRLR